MSEKKLQSGQKVAVCPDFPAVGIRDEETNQLSCKAKLQKFTALQLEEMRSAGIEYVSIIGGACAAANTIKDQLIKIAEAKPLPLVGCDNESCMCIYGAKEKPRTEAQRQAVDQALKERGISFKVTWK